MVMHDVHMDTLCKDSAELQEFPRVLVISPTLIKAKYASVYAVEKGSVRNNYYKHVVKKLRFFLTVGKLLDF